MSADAIDALSRLHCMSLARCSAGPVPGWDDVRDGARAALAALGASARGWEPCSDEGAAVTSASAAQVILLGASSSVAVGDGARPRIYRAALALIGDGVDYLVRNSNDFKGLQHGGQDASGT